MSAADDRPTPVPPEGRHFGLEPNGDKPHEDEPRPGDDEAVRRALKEVPEGKSMQWYARTAAVFAYKSAESAASAYEMAGKAFRQAKETRDYIREVIDGGVLRRPSVPDADPANDTAHTKAEEPPMRDKLPSLVDVNELERLPPTPGGQPRYGMTSGQMQAVIEAKVEKRLDEKLRTRDLESAAAPVLFVKGKLAPALLMAMAGAAGMGLYALILRLLSSH